MATKINPQLVDEYGLNEVTFRLLRLASKSDIEWNGPGLKIISGQPANALRKLVNRGLLSGPGRGEKITARSFSLTEEGRETLGRIERGLHRPDWLSAGKVKVLTLLERCNRMSQRELQDAGANVMSLLSVLDVAYVEQYKSGDTFYHDITRLGREALEQWRTEHPNGTQ